MEKIFRITKSSILWNNILINHENILFVYLFIYSLIMSTFSGRNMQLSFDKK